MPRPATDDVKSRTLELRERFVRAEADGDDAAASRIFDEIATLNGALVEDVARRYRRAYCPGFGIEDARQLARLGMLAALREYRPASGMQLSAYMVERMRWGIVRGLNNARSTIRIPVNLAPTSSEAAMAAMQIRSLDAPVRSDEPEGATLGELLDSGEDTLRELMRTDDQEAARRLLEVVATRLDPATADMVMLHAGCNGTAYTLDQIARATGMTRDAVRYRIDAAHACLKRALAERRAAG